MSSAMRFSLIFTDPIFTRRLCQESLRNWTQTSNASPVRVSKTKKAMRRKTKEMGTISSQFLLHTKGERGGMRRMKS